MIVRPMRFNIYLLCLPLLAFGVSCSSPAHKREKQLAVIRFHVEVNPDTLELSETVPIYRAKPVMVNVDRGPFLREDNVSEAKVIVDQLGGFALLVQFNQRGTRLLEQFTATHPGKRFAIYAEFGEKTAEHRWLGAPVISHRISDGVFTFTPDATRDEAEQIAIGLRNVAIKNDNQPEKKKAKSEAR
jgi:preprotein translocase subunit SecD